MTRKTKFFSLILSLILVLVSVPMSVVSEEITDEQDNLSVTQPSDELVEQSSFEEMTEVQGDLDLIVSNDELVDQELTNEITSTTTTSNSQLVTGIPDGIYGIESANLGMNYIIGEQSVGYAKYNYMSTTSPIVMGYALYLFSITRVPNTDRYVIRPMTNNNLGLCESGDYYIWGDISADNNQVSENSTYNIIYDNGSYLIRSAGSGKYVCGGTSNYLSPGDSVEDEPLSHWKFRGYRSYIEDGVYSFKNVGNSGMWASTENDSYEAGAYIQQKAYDDCPIDSFSRGGMFKINRIGDTNQYTIRLMTNNLLAWSLENSSIVVRDLPQNESEIPDSMKFYIAYDADSYIIIPYTPDSLYMTTVSTTSSSDNLTVSSSFTISNISMWKLYKYIGQSQHGIDIVNSEDFISNGAIVGETYNFKAIYWSTDLNIHDFFLALPSQYSNDATLNWNSTDKTASFTANTFINIGINVGCYTATNGFLTIYIRDPIMFYTIKQEETVYLQNRGSEKYASVSGTLISGGGDVGQYTYSDSSDLKWIVERDSNNIDYGRFKSLANGKYLGVDLTNTTNIYQYDTRGDNTFWKIASTESGASQIISKVYESSGKSLSIPTQSMLDGDALICYQYTNDTDYSDEWNLVNQVISYVNYYDTSVLGNSEILGNINNANSFADSVYSRYFGVGMYMDGVASKYHSIADDCPKGNNSQCFNDICGANCFVSHHKNITAMFDQLYYDDRESNHMYILWTNRPKLTYCKQVEGAHRYADGTAYGMAILNKPMILFFRIEDDTERAKLIRMSISLAHEIAHTLGMDDVYDNEEHKIKSEMCIMDYFDKETADDFYDAIKSGDAEPFCSSCMEKMFEYTSNINITGNQGGN